MLLILLFQVPDLTRFENIKKTYLGQTGQRFLYVLRIIEQRFSFMKVLHQHLIFFRICRLSIVRKYLSTCLVYCQ